VTDRELLERAAKAAGMFVLLEPWPNKSGWFYCLQHGRPAMHYRDLSSARHQPSAWNPLTDDGDALRLFCRMPWLAIETSDLAATVLERGNPDEPSRVYLMWTEWLDKHNGDLSAATRRAIVRAAAAMADEKAHA